MAKVEVLTWSSLKELLSYDSAYIVAYAWLAGMSIWVSFFGGTIAYKTLPRQQFGALQHRTFPVYFQSSILLSAFLLGRWVFTHPDVLVHWQRPAVTDVAQAYALLVVLGAQASNHFVVGPLTSKTMFQRHRLEREENKDHHDPTASQDLKSLNKRFAALHGISSLANLIAVIALVFHGLWIGNAGLGGY